MSMPIFIDHNSTTPVDKHIIEKMIPFFNDVYGNPSSIDHLHGQHAKKAVQESRSLVAKLIGCRKDSEIIFTSGATESNNIALIGCFRKYNYKGKHIISSPIEHSSVLETLDYLDSEGAEVTFVSVDKYGTVKMDELIKAIRKDTILMSIMSANNEIGTIQPIKTIGEIAKKNNIIFHTDAAQLLGHSKINVYDMNIDLMSFTAHKFYGPKGVGGLFIRSFSPYIKLSPIMFGGGQERGLRPGTHNVPGIVGLAEALKIAIKNSEHSNKKNKEKTRLILNKLKEHFPKIQLNGHPDNRLAHNLNMTIPGIEGKALIQAIKNKLSLSAGSACSTIKVKPSHVLKAIGLTDIEAFETIRIGVGKDSPSYEKIVESIITETKNIMKLNRYG